MDSRTDIETTGHDRPIVVAEVGQAHDGSLGTAHAYIDAIARAGADAVKFQTHIADAESHPSEPWRVKFSQQDESRFDYWKRMEFSASQWRGLYDHAREAGLDFISSPFSIDAVEMLMDTGIDRWKIASGEVGHVPMLERIASDHRPVILSSGMSTYEELDRAVDVFETERHLTVLQCTSAYPTAPDQIGLNVLSELRSRYGRHVGLSDHSGTIFAGLAAATLGAEMIEVHVTMSDSCFGPDVPASLTFDALSDLCVGVEFIHTAVNSPITKTEIGSDGAGMRALFTRSLVTTRIIKAGEILHESDVTLKKPGSGIPYESLDRVIGSTARTDLEANHMLTFDDLNEVGA